MVEARADPQRRLRRPRRRPARARPVLVDARRGLQLQAPARVVRGVPGAGARRRQRRRRRPSRPDAPAAGPEVTAPAPRPESRPTSRSRRRWRAKGFAPERIERALAAFVPVPVARRIARRAILAAGRGAAGVSPPTPPADNSNDDRSAEDPRAAPRADARPRRARAPVRRRRPRRARRGDGRGPGPERALGARRSSSPGSASSASARWRWRATTRRSSISVGADRGRGHRARAVRRRVLGPDGDRRGHRALPPLARAAQRDAVRQRAAGDQRPVDHGLRLDQHGDPVLLHHRLPDGLLDLDVRLPGPARARPGGRDRLPRGRRRLGAAGRPGVQPADPDAGRSSSATAAAARRRCSRTPTSTARSWCRSR